MNIKDLSFKEKIELLESDNCPLKELKELSDDKNWVVRYYVSKNKNCSLDILEKLSNDEYRTVRFNILDNNNCPSHLLIKLYDEFPGKVREHPNCPDYLKVMLK